MTTTRKELKADNTKLRSQIAVHNHETRKSLHDMIRMTRERNEHLVKQINSLQNRNEALEAELVLAKAEQVETVQ